MDFFSIALPKNRPDAAGVVWFPTFPWGNNNDGVLQKGEGAMCSACHVAAWTAVADYALPVQSPAWVPAGWVPPVFTDFTYDNLGVPKSEHPLLLNSPVDLGLGAILGDPAENGKFKVMKVRNIGLSAPYAHAPSRIDSSSQPQHTMVPRSDWPKGSATPASDLAPLQPSCKSLSSLLGPTNSVHDPSLVRIIQNTRSR